MIRKSLLLIFLLFLFYPYSYSGNYSDPKPVVVTGKIINFELNEYPVTIAINIPGFKQNIIEARVDNSGYFSASFEIYRPTDVAIAYKYPSISFFVIHPGDSIHVEFDGKKQEWFNFLKTIKYSGDASETNQDVTTFLYMFSTNNFFSTHNFSSDSAKRDAVKNYDLDKYIHHLDTIQQKGKILYDEFIKRTSPNEETKTWALTYVENEYFESLSNYPSSYKELNNLSKFSIPMSYYVNLLKRLPVTESMLICGGAISEFANCYYSGYINNKEFMSDSIEVNEGRRITGSADSSLIYSIIKNTPDALLRQIILTNWICNQFEKSEIDFYEKYRSVFDKYIQEPFLKEPLQKMFIKAKKKNDHPQISNNAILCNPDTSSFIFTMNSILQKNKGKVIYIDFWATWCGPCRSEMPNSKKLMEQMAGKDVAFVFICLDSEENVWKTSMDDLQMEGQHYFLNREQSSECRKMFNINGIPYYFLIDKEGTTFNPGSDLRPYEAKETINTLLNL